MKVEIYGKASQKIIRTLEVDTTEERSLMDFLRDHGVPIASSCYGEGVCRKCIVNSTLLSCQLKIRDIPFPDIPGQLFKIEIDYL